MAELLELVEKNLDNSRRVTDRKCLIIQYPVERERLRWSASTALGTIDIFLAVRVVEVARCPLDVVWTPVEKD